MNRNVIDRVFRRDYSRLFGFDLLGMVHEMRLLTEQKWFNDIIVEAVVTPVKEILKVLDEIVVNYLRFDPERFNDPMDQYMYIYESKDEILKLVKKLDVERPMYDPVKWCGYKRLYWRFEFMIDNLLRIGSTHNFDDNELEEILGDVWVEN